MTFLREQLAGGAAGSSLGLDFVQGVSGVFTVSDTTFTTIGSVVIDPTDYPGSYIFQAVLEVTSTYTAQVRLFDVTAAAAVASSTLSSTSVTPAIVSGAVTLPSSERVYEIQLRMTTAGVEGDTAVCKSAGILVDKSITLTISPAQITDNEDDYSPTDWGTATHVRLNTDASRNITGLDASADMGVKTIINVGSNDIVLMDEDTSSVAANRISVPGGVDLTLEADESADLYYDTTTARWRIV